MENRLALFFQVLILIFSNELNHTMIFCHRHMQKQFLIVFRNVHADVHALIWLAVRVHFENKGIHSQIPARCRSIPLWILRPAP